MGEILMMKVELLGETPIYIGFGIQSIIAVTLGGLIGYDREKKLKAAGLKTHMLICFGSSIFTSIGLLVATMAGSAGDPNRIAAQIVSGVGFLGAGAIIRGQGNVIGLTSAATIWLVAAIGFTVGAGFPVTAAGFTITVLVVLNMINPVYKLLEKGSEEDYFQIQVLTKGSAKKSLIGIILNEGLEIDEYTEETFDAKKGKILSSAYLFAHQRQIERMTVKLKELLKVEDVTYHSVVVDINRSLRASEFIEEKGS